MGKIRVHKASAKRFKVTSSGKLKYKPSGWGHLKAKKDARIKYRKTMQRILSNDSEKRLKELMQISTK